MRRFSIYSVSVRIDEYILIMVRKLVEKNTMESVTVSKREKAGHAEWIRNESDEVSKFRSAEPFKE